MKIIGVTGTSGAGKTTVCKMIAENFDAEIIYSDKVARELSKKGTLYLESIVNNFGEEILNSKGGLNRKKLANIIYTDHSKKEQLNQLTFMYVCDEIKKRISKIDKKEVIILDVPLLFESKLDQVCDFTIAIIAKEEVKIKRICERDNISKEEAILRLHAQNSNEFFMEYADYVIHNNSEDIKDIKKQIDKIKL